MKLQKYLVDVFLPAAGRHYDAFLPSNKPIREVTGLLVSIMNSLAGGSYRGTGDALLLDAETGERFDPDQTVEEAGIRNASRLILI